MKVAIQINIVATFAIKASRKEIDRKDLLRKILLSYYFLTCAKYLRNKDCKH